MKKILLILVVTLMFSSSTYADERKMTTSAVFDAPNLIQITKNVTLGFEGGKEVYDNLFFDNKGWVDDDFGYFLNAKITFHGCLLFCK